MQWCISGIGPCCLQHDRFGGKTAGGTAPSGIWTGAAWKRQSGLVGIPDCRGGIGCGKHPVHGQNLSGSDFKDGLISIESLNIIFAKKLGNIYCAGDFNVR